MEITHSDGCGKKRGARRLALEKHQPAARTETRAPTTPRHPPSSDREALVLTIGLGLICLAVYVYTLCPTVMGGDSGELTTAAYTLGVAHPPGYPLFTLLGKAFCFLPWGSVAWRVNLFSAVCNSLAAVLLLLTVRQWTGDALSGFVAGGLFAFSPLAWRYAVVAEVFSLNNFFVCLLFYLATRYLQENNRRIAVIAVFVFALGLSNHHTLLFYGIPLCVWMFVKGGLDLVRGKSLAVFAGVSVMGLLPYLYLPIAGSFWRINSWGDPTTLHGFFHHFLRKDYGTFTGVPGLETRSGLLFSSLAAYVGHLPEQLLYGVGLLLALWGLIICLRSERWKGVAGLTLGVFLFYLIGFQSILNLPVDQPLFLEVQSRFWLMANIPVFLWAGAGFADLRTRSTGLFPTKSFRLILYGLALAAAVTQIVLHYRAEDKSRNFLFYRFGKALLSPLPRNALLIIKGDIYASVLRYPQECEGFRKDVRILDVELLKANWAKTLVEKNYPDVVLPGTAIQQEKSQPGKVWYYDLVGLFDANRDRFPLFVSCATRIPQLKGMKKYEAIPFGLTYRIVPEGTPFDLPSFVRESGVAFNGFGSSEFWSGIKPGSWEDKVLEDYIIARHARADRLETFGKGREDYPELLREVARIFEEEELDVFNTKKTPFFYKHLGVIYFQLRDNDPGAEAKMRKHWEKYLASAGPGDQDIRAIKAILAGEGKERGKE